MRRHHGLLFHRVGLVVVLLGLAGSGNTMAQGTTMGFTHQFHFPSTTGPNLHWISIPWRYQPVDVGTPSVLDAEDLCQDLGGAATIAAVARWDEASSTVVEHACGEPSPFALVKGIGYALRNQAGETIAGALAGAHDDAFAYSIAPSGGSQLTWVSVPYHVRIPEKHGDLRVTAEDLCRQIDSVEVFAILRWDEATATYQAYGCGSQFQAPFEIVRGEAYGLVNREGQTIDWQPIHY